MNSQLQDMVSGGDGMGRQLRTVGSWLGRRMWTTVLLSALAAALTLASTVAAKPPPDVEGARGAKAPMKFGPPTGEKPVIKPEAAVVPIPASEVKGPHPVIKADDTTHDFGAVWVGPPLKHAFKIKNEGDAPLEISKVKPSCGCTVAGDYPKKLDPGQEGEFPFSMMSTKLRGTFEKGITISSSDPVTPELRLKLKGEVKRYVDVVPTSANFGKITSQEPQERVVNITNNRDEPLKLTLVPSTDSKFKYDLVEKTPGKQFDLHVTAAPPFEEGTLKSTLTINTNVEDQKDIQVEVLATVPARLEVQPAVVTLTRARSEGAPVEGLSRVIKFTNYGKTPTKVLEATVDDPAVTVSVTERKAGEAYTIQVQMPAGYDPPPPGRTITLKTDDAQKPIITVPIQAPPPSPPTIAERQKAKPVESLVGQPAPAFNLETIEGKPLNSQTLANTVTVLDFFAPNCGFCKKQIPRVEPIREKYVEKGVRFVNISQKMGAKEYSKDEVTEVLKGLGFKGELALDHANSVGPLFRATSYPTMVVVGKTGKVEAVNSGNLADLESRLTGQLDALLAGKPVPTDAPPGQAPTDAPAAQVPAPDPTKNAAKDKGVEAVPKRAAPEDLVGKPVPTVSLTTVAGKPVSNVEFAKSPATVIDFFAPNCGFCKKQMPRVETVRKTYAEKGVRFVNIAETMGKEFTEEDTLKVLKDLGVDPEVARDPGNTVGHLFNVSGFPTMVVVGKSGKVEAVNVGNLGDLETKLQVQLDALIAGKPIPAAPTIAVAGPKEALPTPPAPTIAAAGPKDAPPTPPAPPVAPKDAPKPSAPGAAAPAPEFSLTTVAGKPLSNAEFAKSPATVLNFFAPNCGFCKKQIPRLETIRKTYVEKGVRFVNVAETMGPEFTEEETVNILKQLGAELEIARDPTNKVGPLFGASGFPTMVVVGKSGKIEATNVGNIPDLETKLAGQLDALIAGRPIPAVAVAAAEAAPPTPESMVGKPAPALSLTTVAGKPLSNAEFAKSPATVIDFFAPNCGFCKKQIPRVETIRKTYAEKGVRFVNVAETMGKEFTQEETLAMLKELGADPEVARDPGNTIGQMFNVSGFPTMVVVGKSGKVEAVNVGNIGDLETKLTGQLDALIAGKPIPGVAAAPPAQPIAPGQPTPSAAPPQPPPQRPAMALVGQPAPAFAIDTLEGKKVSSDDFKNHPATVLNFVAPNCGFCKKQLPNVESIRAEYEAKGVRFVNIAQKMGAKEYTNDEIIDVFKGVGSRLELAKDTDNQIGQLYKAVSYPTMIVVNKDGKIEHVNVGAQQDIDKSLKTQLDRLIAGKPAGGIPGGN
jgi:thiol-disulfide isomerase/thioredoxin